MFRKASFRSIFAATIFLILGYLVLWNTYVGVLGDLPAAYSTVAPRPVPASGEIMIRGSVTRDGRALISETKEASDRIALANKLTPLHPAPYVWRSRGLASNQEFEEAIALLEFAKKRNPRNYPVRRLLAEYYLLTNDMGEALQEMFSSALLNPDWGPQFMEAVRLLGNNEQLQPEVIEKIASEPEWTNRFFAQLDIEKADDPFVMELSKQVPPIPRYRKQLIHVLANKGSYDDAYALWLQDIGRSQPIPVWPYDSKFDSKPGPRPFNWTINNNADARAELQKSSTWSGDNALYVYYFGRKRTRIVRQIMMNSPGHYSFSIPYRVNAHEGGTTRMKWVVSCVPGNAQLVEAALEKNSKSNDVLSFDFTVPSENCRFQSLQLIGEASGRTGQMDVEFRSVDRRSLASTNNGNAS